MKRRHLVCWASLWGLVILALLVACGGGEGPAPESPTAGGEELLQARCTKCHGLEKVQAQSLTLDEWEHEVAHMRELGAQLTDAEAQVLVEYLAETYAP
jgi:mono/diheme cytochrome c family protein